MSIINIAVLAEFKLPSKGQAYGSLSRKRLSGIVEMRLAWVRSPRVFKLCHHIIAMITDKLPFLSRHAYAGVPQAAAAVGCLFTSGTESRIKVCILYYY